MKPHPRYEIIGPLAKGDYATVYRAKDLELDREVAIKQIHQQYLDDPQQLDRYWQEAQLLARLEHPRIMTIYDIVRDRGWLVLELMNGSLQQIQNGAPIDLNVLRMALTCGLHALHFLSQNGIIHGDVKPSNLLVDKNNRIKLGDFGIARRMSGDPGSIIKGTTKYMAPEVLSDQFGAVGPHSDLYSLGFACYELMCGSHFDSLFPGLDMFGRDRQMAWMMWHSSQDRRLPEIHRVLQGVPEDLTYVIQKLVEKDPAKRYHTAEEVIHDMQALSQGGPPSGSAQELEAVKDLAQQAKRKRLMLFGAFGVSVALSLAMLFFTGGSTPEPDPKPKDRPTAGRLEDVNAEESKFFVSSEGKENPHAIAFNRELDRVFLNERKVDLADLEPGDEIKITYHNDQDKGEWKEVSATRSKESVNTGVIVALDASASVVTVSLGEKGETLELKVPATVKLLLNEESKVGNRPIELADLKAGDQVVVSHIADGESLSALSLHVNRKVSLDGSLVSVDAPAGKIVVRAGQGASAGGKTLAVAKECVVSLNGATTTAGRAYSLADLQPKDKVQLEHDARVTKITAFRLFTVSGEVQESTDAASFAVKITDSEAPVKFTLAPGGRIELAGAKGTVDISYLRPGDKVEITHDSPDLKNPQASLVEVEPQFDKRAWAVVIVEQQYDDKSLAEIKHAAADGKLLRETLAERYRVPEYQILSLEDVSRLKLEQELDEFLRRVTSGEQLLVYYLGHGHLTPEGAGLLTPREFEVARAEVTGFALKSLVARMEACAVPEKVLLLDACQTEETPSSDELVASLRAPGGTKVSSSVSVLASCVKGQSGAVLERSGTEYGAFAWVAAEGLGGKADANRDLRVTATELYNFVNSRLGSLTAESGTRQTPANYPPDTKGERITKGGKDAVRKLLAHLSVARSDPRILADDYLSAEEMCPGQPEPKLAYGLVLLKQAKGTESVPKFEAVKAEHPEVSLTYQALAWHHFNQGNLPAGVADLVQLIGALPRPASEGEWDAHSITCLTFAGELRQFALKAAERPLTVEQLADLDALVKGLDKAGRDYCVGGAKSVDKEMAKLDAKILDADGAEKIKLGSDRKRHSTYATFDFSKAAKYVRDRLDKEK